MRSDLDPEALALLGLIRRQTQGGAMAPDTTSTSFAAAYHALISSGLIEHSTDRQLWVISDAGERLLHDRYDDKR